MRKCLDQYNQLTKNYRHPPPRCARVSCGVGSAFKVNCYINPRLGLEVNSHAIGINRDSYAQGRSYRLPPELFEEVLPGELLDLLHIINHVCVKVH